MQPTALYPIAVTFLGIVYFGAKLMTDLVFEALYPWCDHPISCYDFRTELSQSVDYSVDACEALYDHTCSFWALNHPLSTNQIGHANLRVYVEILKLLSKPPKRSSSVFDKTVTAFAECQAVVAKKQEHLSILLDLFKDYSLDWPSLMLARTFNVLEVLLGFSMDLGFSVIFGLELTIDFKTDKRYGFVLSFSNVDHNSSDMRNHKVIRDCIGRLNPRPGVSADDLAERIVSMNTELRSLNSGYKLQKKFSPRRVSIENVGNATSPVFSASGWTNAINKHLPQDRQINSGEEIVIYQEELLPFIKEVLRGKGKYAVDLMIYVGWAIIRALSSGLSFDQTDCAVASPSPPGRECVQMVGKILPFPLGRLLFDAISPPGVENVTSKIMNDILKATKQSFEKLSWMDSATVIGAKDRVDTITTVVSLPSHLSQRKDLEAAFDYVPSFREPFIRSYLETLRKLSYKQKRLLVHDPAVIVRRDDTFLPMTDVNAYYLPLWHMMVIPGTILLPPFVHPSFPAAVNYGSIGKVLGHELTHSFDFDFGQISKSGDYVDWYSKDSREKFRAKLECVIDQVETSSEIKGIGRSSISESFADTAGVEKAHSAYSQTAKGQGLLRYTPEQLFFVSGCFAFCAMEREGVDPQHKYPPTFLRCDVPASNEDHFAEVFKCQKGARLNPKKRCDFH